MITVIFSSSFLEFLEGSKTEIAKFLVKAMSKNYTCNSIISEDINYLTFRKDGQISYLPKGKALTYTDSFQWSKEGRQEGKPAKVIKKIFSKRVQKLFKDADFEAFTNGYKSKFNEENFSFELLPSNRISEVYDMDIAKGEGSLGSSCMKGNGEYLEIYDNCQHLQILTLTNKEGLLSGRALVWTLNDGDIVFMDRIYVTDDFLYENFLDYASENNMLRKQDYKSYSNKTSFVTPSGDVVEKRFTVSTETDFDRYPYIDTFSYGGNGYLTNNCSGEQYTYNDTCGQRDGEEETHEDEEWDEIDNCYISQDSSVYISSGGWEGTTHENNAVHVDGEWYLADSDAIVRIGWTYYVVDSGDVVYSEYEGEYLVYDNAVAVGDDYVSIGSDAICEIEGDYYFIDSDEVCEIDGDYYLISDTDTVCEIRGGFYLIDDTDTVCEIDGDYYLIDSDEVSVNDEGEHTLINKNFLIQVSKGWYYRHNDAITLVNGTYYLKSDRSIVNVNGVYYRADSEDIISVNNVWYLKASDEIVTPEGSEERYGRSVYFLKTDEAIVQINNEWHIKRGSLVCNIDGVYYLRSNPEVVQTAGWGGGAYMLKNSPEIVEIGGKFYDKTRSSVFEMNGVWVHADDMTRGRFIMIGDFHYILDEQDALNDPYSDDNSGKVYSTSILVSRNGSGWFITGKAFISRINSEWQILPENQVQLMDDTYVFNSAKVA